VHILALVTAPPTVDDDAVGEPTLGPNPSERCGKSTSGHGRQVSVAGTEGCDLGSRRTLRHIVASDRLGDWSLPGSRDEDVTDEQVAEEGADDAPTSGPTMGIHQ
jgi:hypothetical protein